MADASGSYLGCFRDAEIRDLGFRLEDHLSIDECIQACANLDYSFAGLQYSYVCFCDNDIGMYVPAFNCDMACSSGEGICGGGWANSVYSTSMASGTFSELESSYSDLQATIDEFATRNSELATRNSELQDTNNELATSNNELNALIWLAAADPLQFSQLLARNSLAILYEATGGSDWITNTNWKSAAATCEWYGVGCDDDGVITSLILSKLNRTVVSHCVQSSNTNALT
jgi:hypothetical protein